MEQYFWEVSFAGWGTIVVAYAIMREGQRKEEARRRAQIASATVAMRGLSNNMRELGPAFAKASESMQRFGQQLREAAYHANRPKGPAPKRRRG